MGTFIEWMPARKYYGKHARGMVVLVNGTPYHFVGRSARREALKFAASFI